MQAKKEFSVRKCIPTYWCGMAVYLLFGLILSLFFAEKHFDWCALLMNRGIFLCLFIGIYATKQKVPERWFALMSLLAAYAFLSVLYKETAQLNTLLFSKKDALLASADNWLFGFQPSIVFSQHFNSPLFSELMFMGYFSYYLMPVVIMVALFRERKITQFGNMLIFSFLLYYGVFILLPAEGPQYYFPFPLNHIQAQGVFGYFIKLIQANGEAPTAAFPSSHVGVSVIVLCWLYAKGAKRLFWGLLPFTILLFFATVYIKAHYATDVIAGLVSGLLVFKLIYPFFNQSQKTELCL